MLLAATAAAVVVLPNLEEEEEEGAPNRPTNSVSTMDNNGSVIIPANAGKAMASVCEVQS
eukprot:CAMPEP_0172323856 /NCGR_PEP_ID=MMETSP1058-20130122/49772_1 /TAXON_ID=83371 /ORGANISM="Detonula confervacea, Strain CCMP 353" /LENGTH=59 /DNA_ID=CAMNT_0013039965 /DNA_START=349 /DNA_END=528 /DNA_ORIENTATION=-